MNSKSESSNMDNKKLRELISLWWDGLISKEDFELLQTELRSRKEAREIYYAFTAVHSGVRNAATAIGYLDSIPTSLEEGVEETVSTKTPVNDQLALSDKNNNWAWLAIAATISFIAIGLSFISNDLQELPATAQVIARVVDCSHDCEWSRDYVTVDSSDEEICAGDVIRVSSGKVQIEYLKGTVLTLHGPAVFETLSEMNGRAILGRLTANVADGSEGFSVLTPRATVVDLGTEFGIDVNGSGATDFVVFEGAIDLQYEENEHGKTLRKRLNTGEAMRFDSQGTISRIVSVRNERFSTELADEAPLTAESNLITEVRDNIERETSWNYYEIVPSGMREDARAFVDRVGHEWNGVTKAGIPEYLLGGDYVKTFQNDKTQHDIEITVELQSACNLYVLFDDRLPAPQWLLDQFIDTGDDIGVDVGPFNGKYESSRKFKVGVGPGISVENVLSVWVRRLDAPGSVKLGATESPDEDVSMYGIVATAAESDVDIDSVILNESAPTTF